LEDLICGLDFDYFVSNLFYSVTYFEIKQKLGIALVVVIALIILDIGSLF
jgi:hypothetical protein